VDLLELGRIQKPPASQTVDRKKVSRFRGSGAHREATACGAEGSVGGVHAAEGSSRAQSGTSCNRRHQTGLVPELGAGRSGGRLYALDGTRRELRREHLALLIADGLSIDDEAHLRVIA